MLGNTDMKEIDLVLPSPESAEPVALGKAGDIEGKSELFKPTLETRTIT